jgi:drug/metabolite transporter (DMT)-like permease
MGKFGMNFILMISMIALTAICWGIYNPLLQWGAAGMGGGRLRPFVCVGLAYFLIAVVLPILLIMMTGQESDAKFAPTFGGVVWSLIAGTAGALGALGIILALSYGAKPIFLAPLVFGFAPVVNTIFTLYVTGAYKETISPLFYAGLILVVVGAVTVLIFRPEHKPAGHGKAEKTAAVDVAPGK